METSGLQEKEGKTVKFDDLVKFVEEQAEIATDPVYGNDTEPRRKPEDPKSHYNTGRQDHEACSRLRRKHLHKIKCLLSTSHACTVEETILWRCVEKCEISHIAKS